MVFLYLISKGCENMEKSLEQLKQEYEKTTVLLEREKRKMQRLKNRQAYLESGSRKQRTHRLITRGAAIESIAPQTKELSEAEFYSLINALSEMRKELSMDETDLRELTDSTLNKLSAMSDEDYAKLELYPDFDE